MSLLYAVVAVAIALVSVAFILTGKRTATAFGVVVIAALFLAFQQAAGLPAAPDGRLSDEQWRVLAVAPLDNDRFLVSVGYDAGDIRTYRLHIAGQQQRDQFLKAQQALKKGKLIVGHANRSRAGLADDEDMGFQFADAPLPDVKAGDGAAPEVQQTANR
jgi:hypothetical protein